MSELTLELRDTRAHTPLTEAAQKMLVPTLTALTADMPLTTLESSPQSWP